MKEFLCEVTQERIDGRRIWPPSQNCPVALAIKDHPELSYIGVASGLLRFNYKAKRFSGKPPAQITAFIRAFDAKRPVKPFKFLIQIRKKAA